MTVGLINTIPILHNYIYHEIMTHSTLDEKVDERQIETIRDDRTVLKSDHDTLGIWQTVCKFKKVFGIRI